MERSLFSAFFPAIQRLPEGRPLTKDQLITRDFLISKYGDLEIYYAPTTNLSILMRKLSSSGLLRDGAK